LFLFIYTIIAKYFVRVSDDMTDDVPIVDVEQTEVYTLNMNLTKIYLRD